MPVVRKQPTEDRLPLIEAVAVPEVGMMELKENEDCAGVNSYIARKAAEEEAVRKAGAAPQTAPAYPATTLWDPHGLFGTAFLLPRR